MLQLCLHSLCGTKGPCHIRHDWCGCRRIVRAYLHETPAGGPTRAGRSVLPLFVLHTPQQCACQAGMLQHNKPSLTVHHVMKSVYISGNDSPHRLGLPDTTPNISFAITRHLQATSPALPWGNHAAQNISVRHLSLMFVSSSYHFELLMTNDVLKRNHIGALDNEEH